MSTLEVGKIVPATGTAITLGDSGDTFTIPASATLDVNGTIDVTGATVTGLTTGKILQVVQSVKTDTASTTVDTGTFADITGTDQAGAGSVFCVKITPAATTSKILVSWNFILSTGSNNTNINFLLDRNSVNPLLGDAAGDRIRTSGEFVNTSWDGMGSSTGQYLDSPSSTSELTYKLTWSQNNTSATAYINRSGEDTDAIDYQRSASTITVVEIGA